MTQSKKSRQKSPKISMSKLNDKEKFEIYIHSVPVANLKEIINRYNSELVGTQPEFEKIKGYSKFNKSDLIQFLSETIPPKAKKKLIKQYWNEFSKNLMDQAMLLISGEHKTEKIQNASPLNNNSGYKVWFEGKNWEHIAEASITGNELVSKCSCNIGRNLGICLHQVTILLMLYAKKKIKYDQFPIHVTKTIMKPIQQRIELIAAQRLFKEEPAVVLDEDYNIYINGTYITMEWGGNYPGKTTKNISEISQTSKQSDIDDWLAKKVTDLILRKIKVKAKTGKPVKILIDSCGVISKIMEREKLVKKILRKLSVLEDKHYPDNPKELKTFLKKDLKETISDINIEPPFEAYSGKEPYLFCSYTHKDKADVYPIINELNQMGFNIWYDQGIPLSTEWANIIGEKLLGCKIFLSFVSENVNSSENTQDEIHLAINEKKPVLAVYLDWSDLPAGLKMRLRRIQGIKKFEIEEEKFYKEIKETLNEILGI